jgi:MGT family glycosyltransferase
MHYGIFTPPVPGHIHPFGALGRELIARGHRVTMLQMEDVRPRATAEGLEFAAIGQSDHPAGSLDRSLAHLGTLRGLNALRFTIEAVRRTTEMICRDAPDVVRACGIDRLLVDQTEPAGGSVADRLKLPFVTVCNALVMNREPNVPPPFTGWAYSRSPWARARNSVGYAIYDRFMSPVMAVLSVWRKRWGLVPLRNPAHSFSALAQISQMTQGFDFPRDELPPCFIYVGPLRGAEPLREPFPWEKLDGRPLIYASLGTLQHTKHEIFRCFAEACAPLDVQLVIAHNGGLDRAEVAKLPGRPLAVNFAPQREIMGRASLTLTHAGLNTVLDSMAAATPMIATPITYEQPAIAARVKASGAGISISPSRLTAVSLRSGIQKILRERSYKDCASHVAQEIRGAGGSRKAASVIEGIA